MGFSLLRRAPPAQDRVLAQGQVVRNKGIGVPMSKAVFGLQQVDKLHVLEVAGAVQDAEPVRDGLAVFLLYGREVGRGAFEMSLAAASKHIKVLKSAGLIRREVRGRTHLCRLDAAPLSDAQAWLQFYEGFWNGRLDPLEHLLRR